jgi:hypothetical protein
VNRVVARISPEAVAGLLATVVVLALIGVRLPGGSPVGPGPSATAAPSVRPSASDPLTPLVRSALATVVVVNERLAATGQSLELELARKDPRVSEVAVLLPRITAQITAVSQPVTLLVGDPIAGALGSDLDAAYGSLADLVRAALRESVQNGLAYLRAGASSAELIRKLAPLTARARAILDGKFATPAPSTPGSGSPGPPGSGSPTPTGSPAATPTPSTVASGSPPVEGGLIVNPGFETGMTPWILEIVPPADASLSRDTVQPGAGAAAARVDIATGTDSRPGISLVQPGVALRAGQTYTVQLLVRASEARDVRVRLAAATGDAYVARIAAVGTSWSRIAFTFDVLVDDPQAELAIDLGRSTATTWIDAVAVDPGR